MKNRSRNLAHAALIAALYVVLTHLQNLMLPGSASWAIQCRLSEALCECWSVWMDSNHRPRAYQARALATCATNRDSNS